MKEIPNLDELLNSYLDDELALRQHTEIQRLIAHDEKIAQRLEELRQCKILVGSLPVVEAPPRLLEKAIASLARPGIQIKKPLTYDEQVGARHLLGRRALTAAAMFGLVAVLAAVVYSILAPIVPINSVIVENVSSSQPIDLTDPTLAEKATAPFSGKLELYTNNLPAIVGFINRAIEENIPPDQWIASDQSSIREPHRLICTGENFNLLLTRLDDIWDKLNSATLSFDTEVFGDRIVVDAVTTRQIEDIINQNDSARRLEVARDFAVLNNITGNLPGREVFTAIKDNPTVDLLVPPKPVLTSNHKTTKKTASEAGADRNINLTIVVKDSK
ncbi:MAG: hypothetical protein JW837_03760 [Sedimentisphaerales bacterium]|nr:hypothetical protein [Sedimentisphaerales bacterium]